MQILITHKHVKSVAAQDSLVEQRLFALADRLQIDQANVVFERRWDGAPPYRVSVHIVTPGPDVFAEGADQTLNAAVLKVLRDLDRKARARVARSQQRATTQLATPLSRRAGPRRGARKAIS